MPSEANEEETVHVNTEPVAVGGAGTLSDRDALAIALAKCADLEAALRRTEREASDLAERLSSTKAEAARQKRRVERDRDDAVKHANMGLVEELAPILDDLERALKAAAQLAPDAKPYLDGVRFVEQRFIAVLQRYGVSVFSTLGEPFDPARAEAFGVRADGDVPEGVVVEEVRRGLMLHERLVRPALVIVSTSSDA